MSQLAFVFKKIVSGFLSPPFCLVFLGLVGLALLRTYSRIGKFLIAFSLVAISVLSMPLVAGPLLASLQDAPVLDLSATHSAQAIVILGGGARFKALEYDGADQPATFTLERLRYGAYLAKRTGLPILVTGGRPFEKGNAEADVMARVLKEDYGLTPKWIETRSRDTAENAIYTEQLLRSDHISRVVLVTHTWHMRRSVGEFRRTGLEIIPAPMNYIRNTDLEVMTFVPNAGSFQESTQALREWMGIAWRMLTT